MNRITQFLSILAGLVIAGPAAIADVLAVKSTQLGPRPFYLVDQLEPGNLKDELSHCARRTRNYKVSDFSIGHRGAALQFPEHTQESYVAAARMGAGILECDVTFTKDKQLVCRHAQCDLHTTTNILATPLAEKCSKGFEPAQFDPATGAMLRPATAKCCTSDITLEEFRTLEGKMDAANTAATTVEEYLGGTADFRTDLYATGGTLLTHAESIELFRKLERKMTPELKSPEVPMPFDGFTQEDYAQKMIDEYRAAAIPARDVWPQSFNLDDVLYWIDENPDFGKQAVFLEGRDPVVLVENTPPLSEFRSLKRRGVNVLAPPMPALLTTDRRGQIVPSLYAKRARKAGLELISWTTERSGRVNGEIIPSGGAFYYNTTVGSLRNDGDILETIDVLVQDVGIFGLFSDWPATTTFYANCRDIPGLARMQQGRDDDRGRGRDHDDRDEDDDDEHDSDD